MRTAENAAVQYAPVMALFCSKAILAAKFVSASILMQYVTKLGTCSFVGQTLMIQNQKVSKTAVLLATQP